MEGKLNLEGDTEIYLERGKDRERERYSQTVRQTDGERQRDNKKWLRKEREVSRVG